MSKQDMAFGTKKDDKDIEYVDILYFHRANFMKTAIDNLVDMKRNIEKKKINPSMSVPMQTSPNFPPQNVPIDEVIKGQQRGIENAVRYIHIIDDLIKTAEESGNAMVKVLMEEMDANYESKIVKAGMKFTGKDGKPFDPLKK